MRSIRKELESRFAEALARVAGPQGRDADPQIRPTQEARFGDYQSNCAMSLARMLATKPRDLAERLVGALRIEDLCEPPEVAGPGFINLRLRLRFLADRLASIPPPAPDGADRLGIEPLPADLRQVVVVDYSGPNVAKQMHVGHLRSTIIGDVIANVLEFQGHTVIRQNHIGDWGTHFGMLIELLWREYPDALQEHTDLHIADMEAFYRRAQALFEQDPAFAQAARARVVALQAREPQTLAAWQYIIAESRRQFQQVYRRLGVGLRTEHERGESAYNDELPSVVAELERAGLLTESEGARCVFLEGFRKRDGSPLPLIVQKSDGGYLYATTDLAALRYRIRRLGADRIIYVTDARQKLHFEMVFATARAASWVRKRTAAGEREVTLEHVTFGSVLGADGKPLKTRSGENVKLKDLLDEAVQRAEQLVRRNEADPAKRRGLSEEQIRQIAEKVGIGAVKYADLSQNRTSDYVFRWDKMLAMDGNTAPYMMYAYARIRSIHRKGLELGHIDEQAVSRAAIRLDEPAERTLAVALCRFAEILEAVATELRPHILTGYLYELAGAFMKFYEACPVLQAGNDELRNSRLRLCELTARTLKQGLALLGIEVVEQM